MTRFTLIILLLCSLKTVAQVPNFSKQTYPMGKLSFSNFKKADIKDISIQKDSIAYYNSNTFTWEKTSFQNINYVRLQEGNHAKNGALIGGVTTALMVLSAVLDIETDENKRLKSNAFGTSILMIGGGTAIGGIIGASTPRWKTYYIGNQRISKILIYPKIQLCYSGVSMNLIF